MGLNFSEISLRQTHDLLNLIETTLQGICCSKFADKELYVEALQKVLGNNSRRGPESVFIVFKTPDNNSLQGRVFYLNGDALVEGVEMISIDQAATYAINLSGEDVVRSNWCDTCESIDNYQAKFHPTVKGVIARPISNFICKRISGDPAGAIIAFNYPEEATAYDADVLKNLSIVIGSLVTLSTKVQETEKAFIYTIEALARSCEAADEDTGNHIVRVNRYSEELAKALGQSDQFIESIAYSAQMHDVGKVHIPSTIIRKEGPLDAAEMGIMKQHPEFGARIIGDAPRLAMARGIALAHHENWNGSGYPGNLKGDEIPLPGRIVKVADIYDALRSKRSYKPAMSHERVLNIFCNGDSRIFPDEHFDPAVLRAFFRFEKVMAGIYADLG